MEYSVLIVNLIAIDCLSYALSSGLSNYAFLHLSVMVQCYSSFMMQIETSITISLGKVTDALPVT